MADAAIQAIVGLGNPTTRYAATRHNVGFWFVEALADELHASFRSERKLQGHVASAELAGHSVKLLKPSTYMNNSGQSARALVSYFKWTPENLLVVHDDLDLPPGAARLKKGGGHGGHNGLRDITNHLGRDFCRLRLGIGHPGHSGRVLGHVLSQFNATDQRAVMEAMDRARAVMPTLFRGGWQRAVQELHTES